MAVQDPKVCRMLHTRVTVAQKNNMDHETGRFKMFSQVRGLETRAQKQICIICRPKSLSKNLGRFEKGPGHLEMKIKLLKLNVNCFHCQKFEQNLSLSLRVSSISYFYTIHMKFL